MIQGTDFTSEDKVFDLGIELSLVGRELLCKCITDKAEGDAYLNDNRYFSWFRQE